MSARPHDQDSLDDEYDDDDDDPEAPDESDQDSRDDPGTVTCPFCGREIVEGSDICAKCWNYIGGGGGGGDDDSTPTRIHPRWVIVTAIVLLAALALALIW